jgi:hypothetical protein
MKKSFLMVAFGMLFVTSTTFAQTAAPAPATPATVTAICKDGTTYSGTTLKGACRGHHGVNKNAGATAGVAPASATVAPAAKVSPDDASAPAGTMAQAPGGGAGKVWVNTSTKVYHCAGDKYYGKTKAGAYMPEADAKGMGYHADHGKTCQ